MSIYQLVQTSENSLRTLPNNGCCSIAYSTSRLLKTVYGFFPTTDVNLSLVQMQLLKIVYGFFPTTDVNLLLIQTPSSEMVQSLDTFLILIPNGIFKPIPDKFLSFQMASLSPSPNGISKPIPASIALTSANLRAL